MPQPDNILLDACMNKTILKFIDDNIKLLKLCPNLLINLSKLLIILDNSKRTLMKAFS